MAELEREMAALIATTSRVVVGYGGDDSMTPQRRRARSWSVSPSPAPPPRWPTSQAWFHQLPDTYTSTPRSCYPGGGGGGASSVEEVTRPRVSVVDGGRDPWMM